MCVERISKIWYLHKSQVYGSVLMTTNIRWGQILYPWYTHIGMFRPLGQHVSISHIPWLLLSYSLESMHKGTHSVFLLLFLAYFKFMHVALNITPCFSQHWVMHHCMWTPVLWICPFHWHTLGQFLSGHSD